MGDRPHSFFVSPDASGIILNEEKDINSIRRSVRDLSRLSRSCNTGDD